MALPNGFAPTQFTTVTPSDSVMLSGLQFLRVGVAGNLAVKGVGQSTAVTVAVSAGEYFAFGAGYVMATNTTATGILAIG
jgi:hypothetical protein